MMLPSVLTMAAFSLAACQTAGGGGCPPLVTYSHTFQKQAARELQGAKQSAPHVAQLVIDYGKLRDACRVH